MRRQEHSGEGRGRRVSVATSRAQGRPSSLVQGGGGNALRQRALDSALTDYGSLDADGGRRCAAQWGLTAVRPDGRRQSRLIRRMVQGRELRGRLGPARQHIRDPAGSDPTFPLMLMGSCLDTQSNRGRFDGILGALAGLEVPRTSADCDLRNA